MGADRMTARHEGSWLRSRLGRVKLSRFDVSFVVLNRESRSIRRVCVFTACSGCLLAPVADSGTVVPIPQRRATWFFESPLTGRIPTFRETQNSERESRPPTTDSEQPVLRAEARIALDSPSLTESCDTIDRRVTRSQRNQDIGWQAHGRTGISSAVSYEPTTIEQLHARLLSINDQRQLDGA